jgi:hypothetical protein
MFKGVNKIIMLNLIDKYISQSSINYGIITIIKRNTD